MNTPERDAEKPIPDWLHPTQPRAGGYEFRGADLMLHFTRKAAERREKDAA